jgi:SAM-dependent methyltransferase
MNREVFDRMAEVDAHHWWFVARRRIITQFLQTRLAQIDGPLRILEIGCGTGSNLPMLQMFGHVEAIEPDRQARQIALDRFDVAIAEGMLPDGLNVDDSAYDLIVMLDVLEHIEDDAAALAQVKRKLKPGGRLLLTVPAMPWLWSSHDDAHHHFRRYTAKGLIQALTTARYTIHHHSHFNTLLFPLICAARFAGWITGRKGGDDAMPGAVANALLRSIFATERVWVSRLSVKVGVSMLAYAEA